MGDNQLNLNPNWMFINITDNSIKCETVFAPCFLQEFLSRDIVRAFQWNMMSGICFKNICDRGEVGQGRDEMIGQEWNVWDGWWAHSRVHCIILFTFACIWNFQWQKKSKILIKYKWSCSLFSRLTSGVGRGGNVKETMGLLPFH